MEEQLTIGFEVLILKQVELSIGDVFYKVKILMNYIMKMKCTCMDAIPFLVNMLLVK